MRWRNDFNTNYLVYQHVPPTTVVLELDWTLEKF